MSAKERLHNLQAVLQERGAVDVKFFFEPTHKAMTAVADEVADLLDAVVGGRYNVAAPLGDSVRSS